MGGSEDYGPAGLTLEPQEWPIRACGRDDDLALLLLTNVRAPLGVGGSRGGGEQLCFCFGFGFGLGLGRFLRALELMLSFV